MCSFGFSAHVDLGILEHLIKRINPLFLTVEPKFIAVGRCNDSFGLRGAAFRPILRVVIHALLHCLCYTCFRWFRNSISSNDYWIVHCWFRWVCQTLLGNRKRLLTILLVSISSDAASYRFIGLAEEVHSTTWNDAICQLKPRRHRTPAVEW